MKAINEFLKETDHLENKLSSAIYGGKPGTSSWTETNEAGCTTYYTDSYNDANNNGVRDWATTYKVGQNKITIPIFPAVHL